MYLLKEGDALNVCCDRTVLFGDGDDDTAEKMGIDVNLTGITSGQFDKIGICQGGIILLDITGTELC